MVVNIPRNTEKMLRDMKKGTYVVTENVDTGDKFVHLTCPECGQYANLSHHFVDAEGIVSPSLQCPSCSFHDHVKLEDWKPL